MSLVSKAELQRYDVKDKPGPNGWTDQHVMARPIGALELKNAKDVKTREVIRGMNEMGPDQLARLDNVVPDESKRKPHLEYDAHTVLCACVVEWTFSDKPTPEEIGFLPPVVAQACYEWLIDTFVLGEAEEKGYTPSSNGVRSTEAEPAGRAA